MMIEQEIPMNKHHKLILLVEDDAEFYERMIYLLQNEGYFVIHVTNKEDALEALKRYHFHLMVVDLRLHRDDPQGNEKNQDGMELIDYVKENYEDGTLASIMFTSYPSVEVAQKLVSDEKVLRYIIKEEGYQDILLATIKMYYKKKARINFNLDYSLGSRGRLQKIASYVQENDSGLQSIPLENLMQQIYDLMGRIFRHWQKINLQYLTPGLTGASIARVQPSGAGGLGQPYAVKIGRVDKMQTENERYEKNVEGILSANAVTRSEAQFTHNLGAISYSFGQNDEGNALHEFDKFYSGRSPELICNSLERLLFTNCRPWYEHTKSDFHDITALYYDAFQLTKERLNEAMRDLVPEFTPDEPYLHVEKDAQKIFAFNPVYWLDTHEHVREIFTTTCITHGDLTGRNIMVDLDNTITRTDEETKAEIRYHKFWLIDFYRTRSSHIMRDLVIMETDIKYRLMQISNGGDFLKFERLLGASREQNPHLPFTADMQKAFIVIRLLRKMALRLSPRGTNREKRKEFYLSLLMGTLNVIRLRHIDMDKKLLALQSASNICQHIDSLNNSPTNAIPELDTWTRKLDSTQIVMDITETQEAVKDGTVDTQQVQEFVDLLQSKRLMLYIGNGIPGVSNWHGIDEFAKRIGKEVDFLGDSVRMAFSRYVSRYSRADLINRLLDYYAELEAPAHINAIPRLPWNGIYSNNHHTMLEESFTEQGIAVMPIVEQTDLLDRSKVQKIYKMHGSLDVDYRWRDASLLPITQEDFSSPASLNRVAAFEHHLKANMSNDRTLLVLHPGQDDLRTMSAWQMMTDNAYDIRIVEEGLKEEDIIYLKPRLKFVDIAPAKLLDYMVGLQADSRG